MPSTYETLLSLRERQQDQPGFFRRLLASRAVSLPLEVLDTPRRIVSELGHEISRSLVPLTPEDETRSLSTSLGQVGQTALYPSRAQAPSGYEAAKGLGIGEGGLGSFVAGVGLEMLEDPLTFIGIGAGRAGAKAALSTGKTATLTARGAGLLGRLASKQEARLARSLGGAIPEAGKGLAVPFIQKEAERGLERLSRRVPGLYQDPGVTVGLGIPFTRFGVEKVIPGTEKAIAPIAHGLEAGLGKLFPSLSPARRILRESERQREIARAGAVTAEVRMAEPVVQRAKELGDDPAAILRKVSEAVEIPSDSPRYLQAVEALPVYARQYVDQLKTAQPAMLRMEQLLGVPTAERGTKANADLIKKQMDIGVLEKRLGAFQEQIKGIANIPARRTISGLARRTETKIAKIRDEIEALRDELQPVDYFEHYLTPQAREFLEREGGLFTGISRQVTTAHASQLRRVLPYSIPEANELSRSGNIWRGFTDDLFVTDPRVIQATRLWRHIDTTNAARLAQDVAQFGKSGVRVGAKGPVISPGKDWVKLSIDHPSVKDIYFPKEIAERISRLRDKGKLEQDSSRILKAWDAINGWFRKTTVVPFPGTAVRNLFGNLTVAAQEGSTDIRDFEHAWKMLSGADGKLATQWGDFGYATFKDIARREGIIGKSRGGMELLGTEPAAKEALEDVILGKAARTKFLGERVPSTGALGRIADMFSFASLGERNPYSQMMGKFQQASDDLVRLGIFTARVRKGDTVEAASRAVRKYMGYAEELTPVERNTFNRVGFFYRWMRHNIPLQIAEGVRKPGRVGALLRFEEEGHKQFIRPEDAPFVPDFIRSSFGIPFRWDEKKKTYEYNVLQFWLPMADLGQLRVPFIAEPRETFRFLAQQMTPAITGPADILTQGAFTRSTAAKPTAGAGRVLQIPYVMPEGIVLDDPDVAPVIEAAISKIRLLNTIDNITNTFRRPTGPTATQTAVSTLTGWRTSNLDPAYERFIADVRQKERMGAFRRSIRQLMRTGDYESAGRTITRMAEESRLPLGFWTRGF